MEERNSGLLISRVDKEQWLIKIDMFADFLDSQKADRGIGHVAGYCRDSPSDVLEGTS
jgi:hypothetical protein